MACVALTSLMATIELEFLQPNHRVSLDDEKPLKSLFQKLSSLEAFLKKEYSNGGAPIRDLQIKIRDFALKAEDAIEIQLTNILQKAHAHRELHRTLQEAEKEAEELLKIINNRSSSSEVEADNIGSLQCSPQFEDKMFGRDGSFTAIRLDLSHQDRAQNQKVVSIFGAPGVGKTTLCQKLYADEKVVSCFDIKAWVAIPRRYNAQQLLCHLLQSMSPTLYEEIDMLGSTVSQLKEQLHKHLKCKRYLIVLEDVPTTLVWDDIQSCFPDDSNASRILLTTLFGDVAKYVSKPSFHISFLNPSESWGLFFYRFSGNQYMYMAPKFKEIAKSLVEECKGLPRSIVTVADRLSKCDYTVKEWKKIEKELLSLGILHKDTQHSSKLADIFNRLPQHLKLCFLYFAVFPKNSQIQEERLIRLWIAEGFVKPLRSDLPLEDIGYKYLEDLRSRGVVKKVVDEKACRPKTTYGIHIDMHSFCMREAQKEGLLCAVNGQRWPLDILANSCRWLSLRTHILDYHVLFRSNIPRSLLFFQRDFEMFISFKHLRIVDLSQSGILKGVPLPLRNLVFLRYLWVPQWLESLDDVVSTNSNLQTLIVPGIDEPTTLGAPTLHLTSKIWELEHLRHLELGDMYMVDPPNMIKEHLQTLVCAMPIHCFRKEEVYYCKFPSIRTLKIVYKDALVPGCNNPVTIVENFEDLSKLEALSVIVPVGRITLLEQVGFPANLKELRLSGTNLPVKVLGVIGELSKLEILKLENIALYGSRVWEVVKGGFSVLKELELEATSVERWVCKGRNQFQKLRRLFLKRCCSLEEIPPRIAQRIGVLFSIELEQCPPCVVSSAKRIQKERMRNLQHDVPRVIVDGKIISCTKSEVWEEEEEDYDESQCTKSEACREEEAEDDDESVSTTDSESSEEEDEEDYYERGYIESKASEEGLEEASEEEDYDEWEATESSEEEE